MLKEVYKTYKEYWGYYWRVTSRHTIDGIFEWDKQIVTLIEESCKVSSGMKILDLGCGGGDQLKVFAQRGYDVVGIDMVPSLIEFAQNQFKQGSLEGKFICGDMRNIEMEGEFDVCVILSGTFGFFNDLENIRLLKKINRALKPDGRLFIDYLSPMPNLKKQNSWYRMKNGYTLREEWYDNLKSTYNSTTTHILNDGTIIKPANEEGYHANEVIRCYTALEMSDILKQAGFYEYEFLCRKHLENHSYKIEPSDEIRMVSCKKENEIKGYL